jgi:hypothetical protein
MSSVLELEASIKDLAGTLADRREKIGKVFEQAGPTYDMSKVTVLEGSTAAKVEAIQVAELEMAHLESERARQARELNEARQAENANIDTNGRALAAGVGRGRPDDRRKTLGEMFVESEAYKGRPKGQGFGPTSEIDLGRGLQATLFQRSAGWAADSLRTGIVVPYAVAPLGVADLFPEAEITTGSLEYYEVTTFTNNAAARSEGAAYAESALATTKRTASVESIGTSLPVTDEQLADVAQARSFVDGSLSAMVKIRLNDLLINGDGNTPNIRGLLNVTNLQTQDATGMSTIEGLYRGGQKIRNVAFANPTAYIMNPDDWTPIRLLTTDDGVFIWGSPALPGADTIWGLPVVQDAALASGKAIAADFEPHIMQLYVREGIEVQVGYVNDDFLKGKQTIRAGVRVAPAYYRGAAVCQVTNLGA